MKGGLVRGFDCVRLRVDDLEAGLRFWRDTLGHELVWRTGRGAGLKLPESEHGEIVLDSNLEHADTNLRVESADAAARQFTDAGGTVLAGPFDIAIGRCVVVRDPWGNVLCLLDWSRGLLETDADGHVIGNRPPVPPSD